MSRARAVWIVAWPMALGLIAAVLGPWLAWTGFTQAVADAEASDEVAREWDAKEQACLEDPGCDLDKFDRQREQALRDAPNAFPAMFLAAMGALITSGGLVCSLLWTNWGDRFGEAKRLWGAA